PSGPCCAGWRPGPRRRRRWIRSPDPRPSPRGNAGAGGRALVQGDGDRPVGSAPGRAPEQESRATGAAARKENDMAGLGDKAKDLFNSDRGEQASDKGLEKAGDCADQKTGGGHGTQTDKGRDLADGKLGNE